ncbi:MAG: hypothetical protein AVDCRST_MAG20-992, partial [uncultured Acidimicrobiales bacterium]
ERRPWSSIRPHQRPTSDRSRAHDSRWRHERKTALRRGRRTRGGPGAPV